MIKVICYCGGEEYKDEVFQDEFTCRPEVGDRVQSKNGLIFEIWSITHAQGYYNSTYGIIPFLKIGLKRVF